MSVPVLVAPNGFRSQYAYTTNGSATPYYVTPGSPPYIDPTRGIVYLDNYLFFVGTQNSTGSDPFNAIYNSAYDGDPFGPWDTTSFILAQIYSNEIVWIDKHHNYLVAFCDESIEFFYDAGNGLGSPLARQPIYAKQIGIEGFNGAVSRTVAKDKDDIYFIGKNENNYYEVYKLSNFMCQPVGTHYVREVLNYYGSRTQNSIAGIESIQIDTHAMIVVTFTSTADNPQGLALVYFPEESAWWSMTTVNDLQGVGTLRSNIILAAQFATNSQRPYYVQGTYGSSVINFNTTDLESSLPSWPTASYYTEIIDMDTSYWKHLSKVLAVGDYGTRSLLLWYSNDPTYQTFNQTITKTPQVEGYQNAVWWDNVTRFRRGALRLDMSGVGPCHHRAFDVVYNMGNA